MAGLDMYIQNGQWKKAIETAEQQSPKVLHKYVAIYAAHLIKENRVLDAMDLYVKHGTPPLQQVG
jgi:intraflagellar transport protein 172